MISRNWIAFGIVGFVTALTYFSAVGEGGAFGNDYAGFASGASLPVTDSAVELASASSFTQAQVAPSDSPPANTNQNQINLPYPIYDRNNDFFNQNPTQNSFDLQDPPAIQKSIDYNGNDQQYIIQEKIGNHDYRAPSSMSFQDFLNQQYNQIDNEYWYDRSNASTLLDRKGLIPEVNVNNRLFDRIFGGSQVDIRPQGNVDLTFGGNYQNVLNPTLTKLQRKQGGFTFDMNIDMNVVGKIGDKLKLTTNYNTQSTFNFENQVKLDYTGYQDEIIKKIEAGNISLPLHGSLITGSQSLFGLKTQLQFGRLTITSVISQQQAQQQNITVQGGAQTQTFDITADNYDENRNYFVAQYFLNNFNHAMSTIPIVNSGVTINRMEVWVTNKTGTTTNVRNVVAFADLGESQPYQTRFKIPQGGVLPYANNLNSKLNSNSLYPTLVADPRARSNDSVIGELTTQPQFLLQGVQDFEKIYARLLSPTEYTFDPRLGTLYLNQQLDPDDVLAVAYQYTYNGQTYQVGEFGSDLPPNPNNSNVLFLKMLKATSARPKLPIWNLMMKNVYSLGAYQVNPEDFYLDIYYIDPGGGDKRYIPADSLNGIPLIRVLGLDRLNNNQDPQPDGVFDFLPGLTIIPASGKIIFPLVQPFGKDLTKKFSNPAEAAPYVYQQLYDSTKTIAEQFPQFNRYAIKGTYKSSVSSDISLGAFNIPQGSVTVTAGGQKLVENVDYTVDYNLGRVKILNQGLLNSGVPINVGFENNTLFSFLTKTLFGTRLDYYANKHLSFGGTLLKEWERPYTNKLNVGDDPISNTIYGIDGTYQSQSGFITRLVNALPFIDTKQPSSITVTAEAARMDPGHSKAIGKDGTVYIDDFEGTETTYDLRFPFISWHFASTPQDNGLFPQANAINDWSYGFGRGKLAWYNIDPFFWGGLAPDGIRNNGKEVNGFYTRPVRTSEIFPKRDITAYAIGNENTFDLRYQPNVRGAYNFDTTGLSTDSAGDITIPNSTKNWAGIQRSLDETDFEQANIEYIQFWVLDPYLNNRSMNHSGDLYVDLGNISEDLLRDGKFEYENGLSSDGTTTNEDQSVWGYAPKSPPITNSFDNDPNARKFQDVGYDGVGDVSEGTFFSRYMNALARIYGPNSAIFQKAAKDPCDDDYKYYDDSYYSSSSGILDRYSLYNNPEGNSPIASNTQQVSFAATNQPESEDLNRDNTINENEQYFEYVVHLNPEALSVVGQNFITDRVDTTVPPVSGYSPGRETWYQIKIPLNEYLRRVGEIPDFKSIRFVRVYMTGFDTAVVLRFARMELVRNQWRKYLYTLQQPGESSGGDNGGVTSFNVSSVGLEENSLRTPIPYVLPPGIQREQLVGQVGTLAYQNEQSLSVQVKNLQNGDARAVYKNINLDLRTYKNLQLFTHCEAIDDPNSLKNNDLTAFIRLGSDFTDNYYEYELPLQVTPWGSGSATNIWPTANTFNIVLDDLVAAKEARNLAGVPLNTPYTIVEPTGARITVVGNPDLGVVVTAMLGVRNPKGYPDDDDDGKTKSAEIWFDELRVSGFDEQGGYAAVAHADITLADLGTVALSASAHTIGFGQLEQQLQDRYKDNAFQYNVATNLQLGKFFGKKAGIILPFYAGISKSISDPQYDPYDHDILLKSKLEAISDPTHRKEARQAAETYSSIGSINFTNVRKVSTNRNSKLHFFSPENLNFTFAYTRTYARTPLLLSDLLKQYHGELGYQFAGKEKYISPFQNLIPARLKYLRIIRDFNLNLLPTNLAFSTAMDRRMGQTILRPLDSSELIIPTYDKYFTWSRLEGFKLNLSRGLNLDFNANALARIDEPDGLINTSEKTDSVWKNILRFGRLITYAHTANASWTIPINKIPLLDWVQATARYGTNYGWLTAPLVLDSETNRIIPSTLGNTINNTQNVALNGDFNLRNLYNKWKFLKKYDTQNPLVSNATKSQTRPPLNQNTAKNDSTKNASKQKSKNAVGPEAFFIRLPLMVKKISLDYTESHATTLPGFLPVPQWIGQNFNQNAPGAAFLFGYQPDSNWLNEKARSGWLTTDTALNYLFVQSSQKNTSLKASLEPFRDFNIDINFTKISTDNLSEYFKETSLTSGFQHLSRVDYGTVSVSYLAFKTSFSKLSANQISETFQEFENNRTTVSDRLSRQNPYSADSIFNDSLPQYKKGYGPYSQDVLIPAFLSAYTKRSVNSIPLNLPLNQTPLPNWRVSYNGLTKMAWAKNIWNAVSITHGYTSTLSIANFNSSLYFQGPTSSTPSRVDSLSGNFITYYNVPVITISEAWSPLIGIDMTWKNSLTTKFEFSRNRVLSLSTIDYQLTESRTSQITGGLGYKFKNVKLPFKVNGKKKRLPNDINFLMDISYANNTIFSQKLDEPAGATPTSGTETLSFSPAFDYTVNNRLNLRVFFDKRYTIPKVSTSYPIRYTDGGVTLRFTLGQ